MRDAPVESTSPITSTPITVCPLCGAEGDKLHSALQDVLFGVPGSWTLRQCENPDCGLLWLDPMPDNSSIGRLYKSYYTHGSQRPADTNAGKTFQKASTRAWQSLLFRMLGGRAARKRLNNVYLKRRGHGRLLDVGCGDGRRLARFRDGGWQVEGQEVDTKAATVARTRFGVHVHVGELTELDLPAGNYDAIILNHVIEHAFDPEALLKECHRLLVDGGRLVVVTPNSAAMGHREFSAFWRGLEPPRHLRIFNRRTLSTLACRVGFETVETWTTAAKAETFAHGSLMIAQRYSTTPPSTSVRPGTLSSSAFAFQIRAWIYSWFNRDSGEEAVLMARK